MQGNVLLRPAASEDRSDFQRVAVDLLGRFMLESFDEYPCRIDNMSPGDVAVMTPVEPALGERVILYVDHVGRIEGSVERVFAGGFAVSIKASDRKREKLAAQLTWLANRHELNLPEDRRHDRMAPKNSSVNLTLEDGRTYPARILDLSLSGAALICDVRPAIGSRITLGSTSGRVVRHMEDGMAVEFARIQDRDTLLESIG
ncbi:PilZ domain-containing protein [Aureimonas populi]|uniref:PilZ domain-containing protein n=1 Tax=Aureimonas populi TaxID=1701758 RepID=A0ABW5CNU2_9HYPH|nr:PilZ domain-containing protein [Aureimonas populi]